MRVPIAAELRKGVDRTYPYYGASGIIDYVDEYIFDFPTVLVAETGRTCFQDQHRSRLLRAANTG